MSQTRSKVFCIGFMKTGTTTLNRALTILGYRVSSKSWKLLYPIMHGKWDKVFEHIEQYDAFEDNPIPQIFEELDAGFPNSKFILTVRESESWYKSVSYHIGGNRSIMHEWVFGRGKGLPKRDKEHTIAVYEQHISSVKEYFSNRPDDLLIYDLSNVKDWKSLCSFLNHPVPSVNFPFANKSNYKVPKYGLRNLKFRHIRRAVKFPFVATYYNLRNMLPER